MIARLAPLIWALSVLAAACGSELTTTDPQQDLLPPSAPATLAVEQRETTVFLAWQPSSDDVGVAGYEVYRDGSLLAATADTEYVDSTAVVGSHQYRVAAFDSAGNRSALTDAVTLSVVDVTPPTPPSGLSAVAGDGGVQLSWQSAQDDVAAVEYLIYRNGAALTTVSQTRYDDAQVQPGSSYSYVVTALDAAGNESQPSDAAEVTPLDQTAPGTPEGLSAEQSGGAFVLHWRPSADDVGVASYHLYRDGALLHTTVDTTYTDTSVTPGEAYSYSVSALDAAGNESAVSAELVVQLGDVTPPGVPQGLTAEQQSTAVVLEWQPTTDDVGVAQYRVYRDGAILASSVDTVYTDGSVAPEASYQYSVSAVDAAGNEGEPSDAVAITVADVTPPSVPQGLTATQQGSAVVLDWQPATDDVGVDGYRVFRDGAVLATTADPGYTDGSVAVNTSYEYMVSAIDASGNESGPSEGAELTLSDITPPTVPQDLVAQEVSGDARLDWSPSSDDVGVTGYRIRRDGSSLAIVSGTTYTDASVVQGQTYGYTVSALDAAGNESAASEEVSLSLAPPADEIRLTNITDGTTAGPSDFGGHGISFADVTGDGLVDFYVTLHLNSEVVPDLFYRNLGGGSFVEEASSRGIDDVDLGSHGAVWADLDNDGDYDLFNGGTGDVFGDASDTNDVYRRNADGSFTDVTPAGVPEGATRAVLAADLERDGDLDLLAVNGWQGQADDEPSELFNEIYRNDGSLQLTYVSNGTFQDAPAGQGATATDFDDDGDLDVFASNWGPVNVLENVSGSFVARSPGSLGISHESRSGITTADVDNDGHVDLLLASDDSGHLYLNDGDGTFTYSRSFYGTDGFMGGFGDLDNDGDLDLVFAGQPRVWVNDGDGSFSTYESFPLGTVGDPRAVAFADIDNDGDLDFFVAQKGATNRLIRNDYGGGNNWLEVRLSGPQGQAGGFGAKVRVNVAGSGTLIAYREARAAYGYLAQDDPVLHFGLGSESLVDVSVTFGDGSQRLIENVTANRLITVVW